MKHTWWNWHANWNCLLEDNAHMMQMLRSLHHYKYILNVRGLSYFGLTRSKSWLLMQDISSHDIDYIEYVGHFLTWGRILSTCVISMWMNDTKCKYMLIFPLKILARKGLKGHLAQQPLLELLNCHVVKSLLFVWRLGTRRWYLRCVIFKWVAVLAAVWCHSALSPLVQIKVWRQTGAKTMPEPIMTYCHLDLQEPIRVKLQ